MRIRSLCVLAGLLAVDGLAVERPEASAVPEEREVLVLGRRVEAAREAIQNPDAPRALEAITALGHDQRYYIMVRGWLAYQLQADLDIAAASRGQVPEQISTRIRFLKQAIRAIDLE